MEKELKHETLYWTGILKNSNKIINFFFKFNQQYQIVLLYTTPLQPTLLDSPTNLIALSAFI